MSDVTDFVPRVEDFAKVVPAVMDHLGIKQADMLGHHTGAMIVTEVAIQFPQRVRKLVMNGPAPFTEEERKQWMDDIVEQKEKTFTHKADGSHIQEIYLGRMQWMDPDKDAELVTRYIVEQLQGFGPFWYGHHAAFLYDHGAAIEKTEHETLVLTNGGDIIKPWAEKTKEMRPDFKYVELDGGGIDPTDQLSEAWVTAVAEFLKN